MTEHLAPTDPTPAPAFSTVRFWVFIVGIVSVVVLMSIGLHVTLERQLWAAKNRPQVFGQVTGDLQATERSGETVRFSNLRGKVVVCSYVYTVCPHGCAVVMGQMQKLNTEFGARQDFQIVSIAVAPERDTAEFFRAYAEGLGVKPANHWWFLTGKQQNMWGFMTDELRLEPAKEIPPKERLNPYDLYEHDLRVVLVDRWGRVRGYYPVFHPDSEIASLYCEKLHKDVKTLLDETSP